MKILTKSFKLDERDVSYIQKVAKENGDSGESSALRAIIREHRVFSQTKEKSELPSPPPQTIH